MGGLNTLNEKVHGVRHDLEEDPVGTVGKVAVGTTVGSVVGGSPGGVAGAVEGAAPGTIPGMPNLDDVSSKLGFSTDKENQLRADARNTLTQGYAASQGTLGQMKDAEGNYVTNMDPAIAKAAKGEHKANDIYINGIKELSQQAIDQGKQADKVYSNDILPQYKNMMERAQTEAGGAMKLQEVGDPNNAVAAATRGLYDAKGAGIASQFKNQAGQTQSAYDAQGERTRSAYNAEAENARGMYDDTIQGMGRQGLADSGILAALGAQATAGQLGGGNLMTGGQMAALQGQNMSQAGMAYARAQGQMQKLREQGLGRAQDLRESGLGAQTQFQGQGLDSATDMTREGMGREADLGARGLEQGFAQSAAQYDRGQQALDRWRGSTGDFEGANNRLWDVQSDIRDERTNYKNLNRDARIGDARSQLGYTTQRESNKLGASMNDLNRVMANDQGYYGGMANASLGQANAQAAGQAGKIGAITNLAGAGMQAYAGMPRAPQQAATAPPEEEYPGYGGYDSNYGQYSGYA